MGWYLPNPSKMHSLLNIQPVIVQFDYGIISGMKPIGASYTNGLRSVYIPDTEQTEEYMRKLKEIESKEVYRDEEEE